jgi:hypothetical protein
MIQREHQMKTIHAWFSADEALARGSSLYRKPRGSTVNVTRVSDQMETKGARRHDEKYLGEVVSDDGGGMVRGTQRVRGISDR